MSDTPRKDAFQQAALCITHPLALGSMAILFLNDYFLRVYTPGWITGKLGDFVWLFFFPFLLTAVLAWILPKEWLKKTTSILISIGITITVFLLGKTWPAFLYYLDQVMEWFLPWNMTGVIDPTDLMALMVLPGTYWLWQRCGKSKQKQVRWALSKKSAVVLSLTIAMVLTVGSKIYNGVEAAGVQEEKIYVHVAGESTYHGSQGGTQWERVDSQFDSSFMWEEENLFSLFDEYLYDYAILPDPTNDHIQYRIIPEKCIDRSTDGGKTWKQDYVIDSVTQAEWVFIEKKSSCSIFQQKTGPFDAIFDPLTNNLILTMGCRGVLVRNHETGEYRYRKVGDFFYRRFRTIDTFDALGESYIIIIFLSGLLSAATFRLLILDRQKRYQTFVLVGIISISVCGFAFPPQFDLPFPFYGMLGRGASIGISTVLALIVLIHSINPEKYKSVHGVMIISGLLTSLTFFTCFMLWGMNTFPLFRIAYGAAIGFSALLTIACHLVYRKMNPLNDTAFSEAIIEDVE